MKHVLVVGGGVVGLSTAWALLEAGHRVTLVEREAGLAQGASQANGGQLSYRYVSPLADAGVPWKALGWMLQRDGPLRWRPEARLDQWRWIAAFLARCTAGANQRTTRRLLALGALSHQAFDELVHSAGLDLEAMAWRAPGKLVVYRRAAVWQQQRQRLGADAPEQALDLSACLALEPALGDLAPQLAGGLFTPGEAVADCQALCLQLGARLQAHPRFEALMQTEARAVEVRRGRFGGLRCAQGLLEGDALVLAAGLHSKALAAPLGLRLPLYPLKGYSLSAPTGPEHRAPSISVTDFERKILYARLGTQLRVAAMVDLVGEDTGLDPARLASLQRAVQASFPQAADFSQARPWAGLRPATPGGAPLLGATPVEGVWLNVGHGALGFTLAFACAQVLAALISGRASPLALDGLQL